MSRIQKLETIYQEHLKNHNINDVSEFLQSIIDVDITKGKYARFLIESFLNDKFLEEDLIGGLNSTVGQAINLFDKHKGKLPIEYRSIYALDKDTQTPLYQSPGDLWNSVKQFQGELSGKELKKEEQEKIYRETEFVYKDEETGFQIVSPLTEESAKWWGKGTRWCTSAEKNNMFEHYAKDEPLFILLMPNGDKLQLWRGKNIMYDNHKLDNNTQFMDSSDNEVTLDYIEQNWAILEPVCHWLSDIFFIPEKHLNNDIFQNIIDKNPYTIFDIQHSIPNEYKNHQNFEKTINHNGMYIIYIPEEYRTKELWTLAVKQNSEVFKYVPDDYITPELCEIAIKQDVKNQIYIPNHILNHDLLFYIISQRRHMSKHIADHLFNSQFINKLVKHNLIDLVDIPVKYRTFDICKQCVDNSPFNLVSVPHLHITQEMCNNAIRKNNDVFFDIPNKYKNKELYSFMTSLEHVPNKYKTKELCEQSILYNGCNLQYIPKKYKTSELCKMAVQNNGEALNYVPKEFQTKKIYELAVKQDGNALRHIPEALRTPELCKLAVQNSGEALDYVPYEYITLELCRIAIKQDYNIIKNIPHDIKKDNYLLFFSDNIKVFEFIPYESKTQEMCEMAVKFNKNYLRFVPDKYKNIEFYQNLINYNLEFLDCVFDQDLKQKFRKEHRLLNLDKYKEEYVSTFNNLKNHLSEKELNVKCFL